MKKIVFIVIAVLAFNFAKAQNGSDVVKVNPLGLIFGVFNASYEHALSEKSSLEVGASYFNWSKQNIAGLGGSLAYRFYFSKTNDAPEGLFVAPVVGFNSLTFKDSSTSEKVFLVNLGAKGGYQWIFDSGIALDLFAGYSYSVSGAFTKTSISKGSPLLGLALGYNF